jgi:type VI secretion system protein ImpA
MADLPEGFDLEALLAPIPGDAPQGIDIREDFSATSPYNRLRDARSEARDAERGQDAGGDDARDPTPLWRSVRELALKTLAETTKDLEVAAWLTEALVRSHGFAGLAAGAQLMAGLADQYWDGLFPLPDDYGMETRVTPVTGLNGRDGNGSLIQPLYKLALFNRVDGSPVAYYQYQQSEQLGTLDAERRQQRIDAGAVPLEELEREARAAGGRAWAALLADVRAARDAWQAMANLLDEAVRRGRMSWPELLAEVVADLDTRNGILTTLGIHPPPPEAQE